jgi:hypothetical protein
MAALGDEVASTTPAGKSNGSGKDRDRLVVVAHQQLAAVGLTWSPSKVRRVVARHQRDAAGVPLDLRYLLQYRDPTGERASARVDRERGQR